MLSISLVRGCLFGSSEVVCLARPRLLIGLVFFPYATEHAFVCVEVIRYSQPNGVMSSAVSLPNHSITEQA